MAGGHAGGVQGDGGDSSHAGAAADELADELADVVRQLITATGLKLRTLGRLTNRSFKTWSAYQTRGRGRVITEDALDQLIELASGAPADLKDRALSLRKQVRPASEPAAGHDPLPYLSNEILAGQEPADSTGDRSGRTSAEATDTGAGAAALLEGAEETEEAAESAQVVAAAGTGESTVSTGAEAPAPRAVSGRRPPWWLKTAGLLFGVIGVGIVTSAATLTWFSGADAGSAGVRSPVVAAPVTPAVPGASGTPTASPAATRLTPARPGPAVPTPVRGARDEGSSTAGGNPAAQRSAARSCHRRREYRMSEDGNVVDAAKRPIGSVVVGDTFVRDDSGNRPVVSYRYYGTVSRMGLAGYVLQKKLLYVRTLCVS